MKILDIIKREITKYVTESVISSSGEYYSEFRLKKRINNYRSKRYTTGKINSNGEYEYWFDEIAPRVNNEIKNLRLDSKYFMVWSKNAVQDFSAVYVMNSRLAEFMETTGRAEELKESTEDFSALGNILLRKTSDGYEKCDYMNTFTTNTLARTVNDTAIIERFYLTQSELRKRGYQNVDNVIKDCGNRNYVASLEGNQDANEQASPFYELYRYTGEVSEKTLFEAQGKTGGADDKYVLAMIIVAGLNDNAGDKDDDEYVLYAEGLSGRMADWFKEAHRGPFMGRWWREGLYELLFDQQTAYNEVTNELMRAIPWNTSAFFRSNDVQTFQNVRHALKRGTIIKSQDLQQVGISVRIGEVLNMRNAILSSMDAIANSYEVVRGVTPASGTPLGTTQMMNENSNKMFDFLRTKLAVPYRYVYKEFVIPALVKNLKGEDIIKLTGSEQFLSDFRHIIAVNWFNRNLVKIGPHSKEMRELMIAEKEKELATLDPVLKNTKEVWKEITPRLNITIVGEAYNTSEVETILQLLPAEQDPTRRAYMIDFVLKSKGIDVPPATPAEPQGQPALSGINSEAVQEQQNNKAPLDVPVEI